MRTSANSGFSIVLADDDIDDQYLIGQAIKEINKSHCLTPVHNGIQLLELLLKDGKNGNQSQLPPDIILLDINMPLLDGFEVLSRIKETPHLRDIPTFVLSTSRSEKDRQRSLDLGANGFYSKPHQYAVLKSILGEICETAMSVKSNVS